MVRLLWRRKQVDKTEFLSDVLSTFRLAIIVLFSFGGICDKFHAWEKTYGGPGDEEGHSIIALNDYSYYIVAGKTNSFGSGGFDVYLIKIDDDGDLLWERTYGGERDDWGESVCEAQDGGYLIAGCTASYGAGGYDVYLIKVAEDGGLEWTKTYGGSGDDFGHEVIVTRDGGYLVVGSTRSYGAGGEDVYLLKLDGNGDTVWVRVLGGAGDDCGYSVVQVSDGSYVVVGSTTSEGSGGKDVYLVKISEHGNFIWSRTYGGVEDDEGYDVRCAAVAGFILTGYTQSFGSGGADVYVVKADSIGKREWEGYYGGEGDDCGIVILERAREEYLVAGWSSNGDCDMYLLRLKSDEDPGVADIGYEGLEKCFVALLTSYGNMITVGMTNSVGEGGKDVYVVESYYW